MSAYLDIRSLSLAMGTFRLDEITLGLDRGDYLVLLGPTGCGKTTLLRAVAGFHRVGRNRLILDGRDLGVLPAHQRRVGYVAQTTDLFPHLSVAENVAFGLRYGGRDRRAAGETLERCLGLLGLGALRDRRVGGLSGGESRKVAIARSLAVGPAVLLLDEPLGMLDPNSRQDVLETLLRVHNELGTTTIHVTHERVEAWAAGSRCAVMGAGRLHQVGPVAEVFRRPVSRFVAEFLGGRNLYPARVEPSGEAVTAWGRVRLAANAGGGRPGPAEGLLCLRPEAIHPADGPAARVTGTAAAVRNFGSYAELCVELPGGAPMIVHLPVRAAAAVRLGEEIGLGWTDEDVHLIPPEAAAEARGQP